MKELYRTAEYQVHIDKPQLPSGRFRIVFFSDLHNCCGEKERAALLETIQKAQPDLLLCGGDMIVGGKHPAFRKAAAFLKKLSAYRTVYMGTGNHEYRTRIYPEYYAGVYAGYRNLLQDSDIVFLENSSLLLEVCGIPVRLYGYDLDRRFYARFVHRHPDVSDVAGPLGEPDPDAADILLAHNPAFMDVYTRWGADLTFGGHYHGGMVRYGRHSGLIRPDMVPFSACCYGQFVRNGRSVIVTAGCGEHTVPVRINNPREIVLTEAIINGKEKEYGASC